MTYEYYSLNGHVIFLWKLTLEKSYKIKTMDFQN